MAPSTITSSFAVYISGSGLFLTVDPAVVLNNNVLVSIQQTVVSLANNATNYIFFNTSSNTLQLNTTGFPAQVIPIAIAITSQGTIISVFDSRPDWVVIANPVSLVNAPGTPLTTGNFSFSGWGSGASLVVNSGTQTGYSITINAGSNPLVQPTITLTFNSGYTNAPITLARMVGGSGMVSDISASNTISQSVLTYGGTPQSGKTYVFNVFVLGQ